MEYNRMALLESEIAEAKNLKAHFPFRQWFIVKPEVGETGNFCSKRRANAYARKHAPAAIYQL